ncbi:MAG TPA: glycosyltransferase family 1 protein [Terriglobales bacterium]|nr:glycosyltransferase family 1 protein [Terriglobales bacterium]
MKIAFDIRRLRSFGIGTYIRNVVQNLARLDQRNQYVLIGHAEGFDEIGPLPANFMTEAFPPESSARNYFEFQQVVRLYGCELVHVPHLFWRPRSIPCPYVVTVHDLFTYMRPRPPRSGMRRFLRSWLTRRVLRHAERIVAVSDFTRHDIMRLFGIPESKIEVLYNAIDSRFRLGHATDTERQLIAERYQVHYPFLLYAGNIKPHKNIVRLIEAFSALKTELKKEGKFPDLKLIIIGDDLSQHPDLRRTVIRSGVQHDVRFLGFVPVEVLRIFYDAAKIFVFPSLYEGFGLPPLEAMAHGTPVVTSNVSSLPEVVGNAAVLVNPENVFDIMRALHRVLVDQPLRERLKQRGYEQIQRFSWETSVARLIEIYEEVNARHARAA